MSHDREFVVFLIASESRAWNPPWKRYETSRPHAPMPALGCLHLPITLCFSRHDGGALRRVIWIGETAPGGQGFSWIRLDGRFRQPEMGAIRIAAHPQQGPVAIGAAAGNEPHDES